MATMRPSASRAVASHTCERRPRVIGVAVTRTRPLRTAWMNGANYPIGELAAGRVDFEPFRVEVRGDVTIVRVAMLVGFGDPD